MKLNYRALKYQFSVTKLIEISPTVAPMKRDDAL